MHDQTPPATASHFPARTTPTRPGYPGGPCLDDIVALVECASGADTAAIDALESIAANLRRAADARFQLAAHVPPEMLRQVLLARSTTQQAAGSQDTGLPS